MVQIAVLQEVIMTLFYLRQSTLRNSVLLLPVIVLFTVPTNSVQAKDISIKSNEIVFWQLIDEISLTMPTPKKSIERLLAIQFEEERNAPLLLLTSKTGVKLADSVGIDKVSLLITPSMAFDDKSALALELSGTCISPAMVREHYGQLTIAQFPRGRSLHETTVYTVNQLWGSLAFAFKEMQPECLFSLKFRTIRLSPE